ncbi:MAG TPA: hypothetical protein VGS08_02330 [Candidatus Saccharimonadales bacterium]|nr:hypothetical protein [Candidatus Saccharimonadales bacterium]
MSETHSKEQSTLINNNLVFKIGSLVTKAIAGVIETFIAPGE